MFSIEIGPRHIGAAAEIDCLISETCMLRRDTGREKEGVGYHSWLEVD
jgi:hypothetical protein